MTSIILRRARIVGDGRLVDVAITGGRVGAIGRALGASGGEEFDLDGRWILPGLWDAHAHFTQWARQRGRIDVSAARSASEAVALLAEGARVGGPGLGDVVVGCGFQDALWPDALTGGALDLALGGRPVVVVSHDLHSVWLNDTAASHLGAAGSGLLREANAFAVEIALDAATSPAAELDLVRAAVASASARGLVGIRDLEMADNVESWASRVAVGVDALRVEACIYQDHLPASDARGWAGGSVVPGTQGLVTVGALKVFSDGSLNTRTALTHEPYGTPGATGTGHAALSPSELAEILTGAARRRLSVALHAIGDLAVTRALDAFEASRATGTIEHAQLVRAQDLPRFARLGIAASVQPQHAIDDRDVADALWADRAARAFPYRSLLEAGAELLLGSDAPVAPLDPWITLAAAVHRSDDDRPSWHPEQELSREAALRAAVRGVGSEGWVTVGMSGDLIAVDHDPLAATPIALREMPVSLTLVGGRATHMTLD